MTAGRWDTVLTQCWWGKSPFFIRQTEPCANKTLPQLTAGNLPSWISCSCSLLCTIASRCAYKKCVAGWTCSFCRCFCYLPEPQIFLTLLLLVWASNLSDVVATCLSLKSFWRCCYLSEPQIFLSLLLLVWASDLSNVVATCLSLRSFYLCCCLSEPHLSNVVATCLSLRSF